MRKPSRPNEAAYQRALKKVARALKHPSDTSWQDDLSEAPEIPEGPDEVIAIIVPEKTPRRKKHPARLELTPVLMRSIVPRECLVANVWIEPGDQASGMF